MIKKGLSLQTVLKNLFAVFMTQGAQIVGGRLIDKIVEPVGVKQGGDAASDHGRRERGVVVRKVVARDLNVDALVDVAEILVGEGLAVILGVTGDEHLSARAVAND